MRNLQNLRLKWGKQGCILSPLIFTIVRDEAVKEAEKGMRKVNLVLENTRETNIGAFVCSDNVIVAGKKENLQFNPNVFSEFLSIANIRINVDKMVIANGNIRILLH